MLANLGSVFKAVGLVYASVNPPRIFRNSSWLIFASSGRSLILIFAITRSSFEMLIIMINIYQYGSICQEVSGDEISRHASFENQSGPSDAA